MKSGQSSSSSESNQLLHRIEEELVRIETSEIVRGLDPLELKSKGFIGETHTEASRETAVPVVIAVDCKISVTVSASHMQATVICTPASGGGAPLTVDAVMQELARAGVKNGFMHAAIAQGVAAANAAGSVQPGFIAAIGSPPIPGIDGGADFMFDTTVPDYDFAILPDGRVDYHATCHIIMTEKDAQLARVREPTPGTPGTTICGEVLDARPGQRARIVAGTGVRASADEKEFFAEINGAIVVNNSIITVVNTFVVNGDVDYTVGNIHFNGSVVVNGSVLDGFEVRAEGDIIVLRNVESARVEAGRDVVIRGGVQGQGKGLVSAGRTITAAYAQNARLEAQGDITIRNFAINSYMFTSKMLLVHDNRGAIIGGETFAQKGVDARVLGSQNGTKTYMTVGTDFLINRKITELNEAIHFCESNLTKLELSIKLAAKAFKGTSNLPMDQKAILQKIMEKRKDLMSQIKVMNAKRHDLAKQAIDTDNCFVRTSVACYTDVFLKIKDMALTVRRKYQAVRFYEDRKSGTIAIGSS